MANETSFDAAVGRFILMFVPDPVDVVRSAARSVRPGGAVAFLEVSWAATVALSAHLPLWSRVVSSLPPLLRSAGANPEMGPALHRTFLDAGLPAPSLQLEVPLGSDPDFTRRMSDLFETLRPRIPAGDPALAKLGNLGHVAGAIAGRGRGVEGRGAVDRTGRGVVTDAVRLSRRTAQAPS